MPLLQQTACAQKQLQVVAGGFVYLSIRRPLLGWLNHICKAIAAFEGQPRVVRLPISQSISQDGGGCFLCLCPVAFVNFRTPLLEQVAASDASEFGGGVTFST